MMSEVNDGSGEKEEGRRRKKVLSFSLLLPNSLKIDCVSRCVREEGWLATPRFFNIKCTLSPFYRNRPCYCLNYPLGKSIFLAGFFLTDPKLS